ADLDRDGFLDVVAASSSTTTTANVGVLINAFGTGFNASIPTSVLPNTALQTVVVTDVDRDVFPDLVVTVKQEIDPATNQPRTPANNVFTLLGNGDGTFGNAVPYRVGSLTASPVPSSAAAVSDPLVLVVTFSTQGTTVQTNLVKNGNFEARDLSGEQGNLSGWQVFQQTNSRCAILPHARTLSPLT